MVQCSAAHERDAKMTLHMVKRTRDWKGEPHYLDWVESVRSPG